MNTMVLNFKRFYFIFFVFTLSCTTISTTKSLNWAMEVYNNERFQFTLSIPKEFKKKYPENGDGITLIHPRFLRVFFYDYNNDIFYSVLCEAPKSDFKYYQKLFEEVVESFLII